MDILSTIRSSMRPIIVIMTLAGTHFTPFAGPAQARSFLDGQENGLQKCARAILDGYSVKHVEIFGRKYNCKAIRQSSNGRRTIQISHHHRLGRDDQFYARFRVDSRNVFVSNSLTGKTSVGIAIQNIPIPAEFLGAVPYPRNYQDMVRTANYLRNRRQYIRNQGKWRWDWTALWIAQLVIAELGNPENRGTGPNQADCSRPSFYVYDNFGGRRYRPATGDYPTIHNRSGFEGLADAMSSVCVPAGYVVHMYEHSDYKGKMWEIIGPKQFYDFKRQKREFHDNISSIRIFENTDVTGN